MVSTVHHLGGFALGFPSPDLSVPARSTKNCDPVMVLVRFLLFFLDQFAHSSSVGCPQPRTFGTGQPWCSHDGYLGWWQDKNMGCFVDISWLILMNSWSILVLYMYIYRMLSWIFSMVHTNKFMISNGYIFNHNERCILHNSGFTMVHDFNSYGCSIWFIHNTGL